MFAQILLQLPVLSVFAAVLAGLLYSWLLYRRDTIAYTRPWIKNALAVARFVVVATLVWLLFSPAIKKKYTEAQKPILIFLHDNSGSVALKTPKESLDAFWMELGAVKDKLSKDYDVRAYLFAESLSDWETPAYSGKETGVSGAFRELTERHSGQTVGAIVLSGDGIYNKGSNPLYHSLLKVAPVYTIALGDTTPVKDARIAALRYNQLLYSGDQFMLRAEVEAYGMQGQELQLEISAPNGFRTNIPVGVDRNDFSWRTEVNIGILKPGIQKILVSLRNAQGDQIPANNQDVAYVEVLDGREKVLLLYHSPHPDVKAIRAVAEQNPNLSFEAVDINTFNQNLRDFSLVILHGLPSANGFGPAATALQASNIPQLYIVSATTDLNRLNEAQQVLKIFSGKPAIQEVQAVLNPAFSKFSVSPGILAQINELPPLYAPLATYQARNPNDALFTQRIGNVQTDFPLLSLGESGNRKTGVLAAEGIWRWRMYDYLLHDDHEAFDNLFGKIIQFLTVKEDRRPFRLKLPKTIFAENQPVVFDAELYNESFELVNDPDVSLEISSADGKVYPFTMDKTSNAYTLSAGIFGTGDYTATAKTSRGGRSYTASISFSVKPLVVESLRLQADHRLLSALANESGGSMLLPGQLLELQRQLESEDKLKPVLYDRIITSNILDFKWILAMLIALLSIEWFVRKWSGGY
jgi:hypothetical protein